MAIDGVERTGLVDATVGRIIFNNPVAPEPGLYRPYRPGALAGV